MKPLATLWQIIDWFSLPVLAALVVVLVWRRATREFPYFFYYIAACELIGLVRLCFYSPVTFTYFYIYWTTDVIIAVGAFLATYELFIKRLFPKFHTVAFYRYLFPTAALVVTLIAVPAALQTRKAHSLLVLIHVLDVFRVTVLIFFVGLMIFMGRRWTRHELGIATGLGLQASAVLITSAVWARNPLVRNVLERLPVIVYDLASMIWLVTFLKPEKPTTVPSGPISPEVLTEARKWQEAAKGSVSSKKDPD